MSIFLNLNLVLAREDLISENSDLLCITIILCHPAYLSIDSFFIKESLLNELRIGGVLSFLGPQLFIES